MAFKCWVLTVQTETSDFISTHVCDIPVLVWQPGLGDEGTGGFGEGSGWVEGVE